jgi:hypothetical protein
MSQISQFSLSLSQPLTNPHYPFPQTVRIADGLLCISCVEKYQLTTFTYIYRLLSTHYNLSPYQNNKTYYNLQLFRFCSAEICWCVVKTTAGIFYSDVLWYWVADLYKILNWMVFNLKINTKNFVPLFYRQGFSSKNINQYCLSILMQHIRYDIIW